MLALRQSDAGTSAGAADQLAATRRLSDDALALTIGTGTEYLDLTVPCGGLNGGSRLAAGVLAECAWTCRFS